MNRPKVPVDPDDSVALVFATNVPKSLFTIALPATFTQHTVLECFRS
jgi:hypothetical protein